MSADHKIEAITMTDPEVSEMLTNLGRELATKDARIAELEAEVATLHSQLALAMAGAAKDGGPLKSPGRYTWDAGTDEGWQE